MLERKHFKNHFSKTLSHGAPTLDKHCPIFQKTLSFEITSVSLEHDTEWDCAGGNFSTSYLMQFSQPSQVWDINPVITHVPGHVFNHYKNQ